MALTTRKVFDIKIENSYKDPGGRILLNHAFQNLLTLSMQHLHGK